MLAISQKPDRVSNDLRSSTDIRRDIGILRGAGRVAVTACCWTAASTVVALMPLLLLAGCLR